jgi:prepilin-type N-terminal cleavage/methylation domain-containing protein
VKFNINSVMKTHSSRRAYGFTLVELLVVIAIIAVLAGAGFAAGNAAIQKAKKTTAMATCIALESAVNNFYTEYGAMPTSGSADERIETDSKTNKTILALLGQDTTLNPRGIKFLSVKEGKKVGTKGMNGLIYTANGAFDGLYDPWGGSYKIVIDGDYDETLKAADVKPKGATAGVQLNGRRVAAWSDGADGKDTGKNGKAADDVVTWNK